MFELQKVDKVFSGVRALKAVDFKINRGEIVGLVGENGAGKSTLMKVIDGAYQHDGVQVLVDGRRCASTARARPWIWALAWCSKSSR